MNQESSADDCFETQYQRNGKLVFTKSDVSPEKKRDTKYQLKNEDLDFVITLQLENDEYHLLSDDSDFERPKVTYNENKFQQKSKNQG